MNPQDPNQVPTNSNPVVPQPLQQAQPDYVQPQASPAPMPQPQPTVAATPSVEPQPMTGIPVSGMPPVAQPMQQPVAPVQPAAPNGMIQPPAPVVAPIIHNKKKNLIIGGVAAAAIVAVIVLIVFVLPMLGSVSKSDYRTASKELNEVASSYTKLGTSYTSMSSNTTDVQAKLAEIKKNREDFNKQLDELGKTKAIKKDKELKEKYEAIKKSKPAFDKVLDTTEEAFSLVTPIVTQFDDLKIYDDNLTVQSVTDIKNAFESAASKAKSNTNKEFLTKMTTALTKMEQFAPQVVAGNADYRKYDTTATRSFRDAASEASDAMIDWSKAISALADQGELYDELSALRTSMLDKLIEPK